MVPDVDVVAIRVVAVVLDNQTMGLLQIVEIEPSHPRGLLQRLGGRQIGGKRLVVCGKLDGRRIPCAGLTLHNNRISPGLGHVDHLARLTS